MDAVPLFLTIVVAFMTGTETVTGGLCTLGNLRTKHGQYKLKSGNSVAMYTCSAGYQLYGAQQLVCFGSHWSADQPLCIVHSDQPNHNYAVCSGNTLTDTAQSMNKIPYGSPSNNGCEGKDGMLKMLTVGCSIASLTTKPKSSTCPKVEATPTLRIAAEYQGAVLKFSCAVSYKLQGADLIICDDGSWSHIPPTCIAWIPPKSCDFEEADMCGWSHHEEDDHDWRRNSGKTKTSRTGPEHDHTFGKNGNGNYMYFESSSPARDGHNAILVSPLYPASQTRQCFKFWYHVLGVGAISKLEVVVAPEGADISGLDPMFVTNENKGEDWQFHVIVIGQSQDVFQILFEATRSKSYRSDIAVDDVELYDCLATTTTVPAGSVTPIQITTVRVSESSTLTAPTVPAGYVTPTQITTARVSESSTLTAPTTRRTPSQTNTTRYSTPQSTTSRVTQRKSTPTRIITKKHTAVMTSTTKQTMKSTLITSTVDTFSPSPTLSPYTDGDVVTRVNHSTPSVTPRINPNVPDVNSSKLTADGGPASILYILLGVGIVVLCVVVGVVIYFVKIRKSNQMTMGSIASVNPLYMAMASDEPTIHFAQLEDSDDYDR